MENKGITESLIDSRIIFVCEEIDSVLANRVIAELLYLDALNHEDINIYINSNGGSLTDGLAIIDTMNLVKSNVNTIVLGTAASMAAIIASCGNKRMCLPHGKMMIHQISFGVQGNIADITIAYENALNAKKEAINVLAKSTHKKPSIIEKDCERDYWLDAHKAKEYGLIDEIIGG